MNDTCNNSCFSVFHMLIYIYICVHNLKLHKEKDEGIVLCYIYCYTDYTEMKSNI